MIKARHRLLMCSASYSIIAFPWFRAPWDDPRFRIGR